MREELETQITYIERGSVSEVEAKVIQFIKDKEITKVVYFQNREAAQKSRTSDRPRHIKNSRRRER